MVIEFRGWQSTTLAAALAFVVAGGGTVSADERSDIEALKQEIETLRRRDAERERQLEELRGELERLKAGAPRPAAAAPVRKPEPAPAAAAPEAPPKSALDRALDALAPSAPAPGAPPSGAIYSRRVGGAELKLLSIGMDVLWAAGGSTAPDPEIEGLQQGGHDPRERGFTLQQAEMSLSGAVDPYFRADAFIVGVTDGVELEEAFFTSTALPWGLQLEGGQSFTEFGLVNPQHPHQWDWIDQPVVNSRMFGGEALRGPGFRVGWLTPLPWFSELHAGMQNADEGEFTTSFIGEDQVGGRPLVKEDVDGFGDLLYLGRWVNSWDLGDALTTKLGVSGVFGPNGTGDDGYTYVYGTDLLWKWQPPDSFRGWPFVKWQSEVIKRDFVADDFVAGTAVDEGEGEEDGHAHGLGLRADRQDDHDDGEDLDGDTLRDWGFYTQVLWGFRHPWALGLRYEYASASGTSLPDGRNQDPLRDDRHRLSPLVVWQPTEFTRFRLQYSYDRARFLDDDEAHTVWFGMEVLYGAHMAHEY
jgi:hypothetical protein